MNKTSRDSNGFTILEILIGVISILLILTVGYFVYKNDHKSKPVSVLAKVSSGQPATKSVSNNLSWIVQYHFLSLVEANPAALSQFSKASKIYAILSPEEAKNGISVSNQFNLIPTVYYNSYAKFVSDYNSHLINSSVKAVVFDDSSDTPSTVVPTIEADNPYQYDQDITSFAHQHGMVAMCDFILGKRVGNKSGEAPPCDVALLNYSQQSERSPADYSSVVDKAVGVIHKTYPDMPVLVGLSTNPRGSVITSSELVAAYDATVNQVNGYWISIPTSGGVGCPNCSPQNPSLLPEFLQQLN